MEDFRFLDLISLSDGQSFYHLLLSPNIYMLVDVMCPVLHFQIQINKKTKREGERTENHEVVISSYRLIMCKLSVIFCPPLEYEK